MQFPESWLRHFCNPSLTSAELAETLTMAGLEVEEMRPVAPVFSSVVIGEIRDAQQHPDADRLRICTVDVGNQQLLSIVCGASNARIGIKVPCALVGAELPPNADGVSFKIKVGKLRGIESYGMLCAAREIGLEDQQDGLLELPADAPVGQDIRSYLQLDDLIFTLKLTPNLSHCLSVYGIARELSALTGAPLRKLAEHQTPVNIDDVLPVNIIDKDLCGRFSGQIIKNVITSVKTPQWMLNRLQRSGQRSVSPLVDISNYVMLELGQPSHIFDLDKIQGSLNVRWGKSGEKLKLLSGLTIDLDESLGIVADDQKVESLAGIMGGDTTSVSDSTSNIYVEAAFWWPKAIAGKARQFNFSTEASHRFERGVDPDLTIKTIERITELVIQICGVSETQCGPVDDQVVKSSDRQEVFLRAERASKVIGIHLSQEKCLTILNDLGFNPSIKNGLISVHVPSYRFDINIEEDLIEELVKVIGYHNLPMIPPLAPTVPKLQKETRRSSSLVRRLIANCGYQETINFSFVQASWEEKLAGNSNPICLLNPIASHLNVMRSSLLGSLLQVLRVNLDRKTDVARIFEIGRVFWRNKNIVSSDTSVEGYEQPMMVAGLAYGSANALQWGESNRSIDFFDVKGDVERLLSPLAVHFLSSKHPALHPGRCARIFVGDQSIGVIGELHPQWRQEWGFPTAPIMFELALDAVLQHPMPLVKAISKQHAVERDIAIVVAEKITYDEIVQAIYSVQHQQVSLKITLFDVYRPKPSHSGDALSSSATLMPGEKSLAIKLKIESIEASLTDQEIDLIVQTTVKNLEMRLNAKLRT